MQSGRIVLNRKMVDWEWWDDVPTRNIFLTILLHANFKDKSWKGITIRRGQLLTSRNRLSKLSGFKIQPTRTALANLQSTSEITIKTTNRYTVITVCNYNKYQDYDPEGKQTDQPTYQPATNQQLTTIKQDNKANNTPSSSPPLPPPGDDDEEDWVKLGSELLTAHGINHRAGFQPVQRWLNAGIPPDTIRRVVASVAAKAAVACQQISSFDYFENEIMATQRLATGGSGGRRRLTTEERIARL